MTTEKDQDAVYVEPISSQPEQKEEPKPRGVDPDPNGDDDSPGGG